MNEYPVVSEHVKKVLAGNNNGHGYDHANRVVKNVKLICEEVECNQKIAIIAAYVHDLIDRKVAVDIEVATTELEQFLVNQAGLSQGEAEQVIEICQTISYSKGLTLNSIEAKVVQDADRLDALGAVGIARTIEYSSSVSRPVYIKGDYSDDTAIGHFHTKLYRLPELMNFGVSKQLAVEKAKFMELFEAHYIKENE